MKLCPTCQNKYPDDANFCPREECAGEQGPRRLEPIVEEPAARFVPISRLGGGASGEVWQANDAQAGSAVAYKVVVPEALPNATALDRAQRELRQLQRAGNPRIVKVIDLGKTPEGRLFIASELASGEPLDQVVARSGPFPLDRAKRVAAQIGEALLEAQKVGVVHRDLAAKNILVSGDDEVRVINFAIARPLFDNLLGVPEYMSPEQSEGKLIDQRSNTYSLGALLYLMLTGHPPHAGATPQATIEAIQKGDITPPSIKRGGGLTAEVDRIVLKALERNSSRRPLTMRQFLTDVSGLIVTEQSSAAGAGGGAGGRDAGFAKTMMFAGGASEVQKLVAQAIAARQAGGTGAGEASGAGTPAAPAARAPTPAPVAAQPAAPTPVAEPSSGSGSGGRPSHGAAVAATMIALPVPGTAIPGSGAATPPPAGPGAPAAEPTALKPGQTPQPAGAEGGNFRETLWFKKGDVDQMVAEARAKVAAMAAQKAGAKVAAPGEGELPTEEAKPLEDRYVDDGTVTVEDRKKFSLRSGATSVGMPARGGQVPGERMSENEMLGEIGGGKRFLIIGIVAAVVVALVAVVVVSMKGKGKGPAKDETPQAEQAPPTPAAEKADEEKAPPPAAEEKAAAAGEKAPAAEKAAGKDEKKEDKKEEKKDDKAEKVAPAEKAGKDSKDEKAEAAQAKPEPSTKSTSTKKKSAAKKKAAASAKKKK